MRACVCVWQVKQELAREVHAFLKSDSRGVTEDGRDEAVMRQEEEASDLRQRLVGRQGEVPHLWRKVMRRLPHIRHGGLGFCSSGGGRLEADGIGKLMTPLRAWRGSRLIGVTLLPLMCCRALRRWRDQTVLWHSRRLLALLA